MFRNQEIADTGYQNKTLLLNKQISDDSYWQIIEKSFYRGCLTLDNTKIPSYRYGVAMMTSRLKILFLDLIPKNTFFTKIMSQDNLLWILPTNK